MVYSDSSDSSDSDDVLVYKKVKQVKWSDDEDSGTYAHVAQPASICPSLPPSLPPRSSCIVQIFSQSVR